MKKSIALLWLIIMLMCAVSCGVSGDGKGDVDGDSYIYKDGSSLFIVCNDARLSELAETLRTKIINYSTAAVSIVTDSEAQGGHEIILGVTERELSSKAYRLLGRIEKSKSENTAYLIYSDGASVAVAFEEDYLSSALSESVKLLTESIVTRESSLSLNKGVVYQKEYDPIDPVRELDSAALEERWQALAEDISEEYGKEYAESVVDAFKDYYTLYTDNLVLWFANLYDPETGGFYYSNSARDTVGYLPDAESTTQALNFISGSGMARSVGGTYAAVIPDWMREQIVAFIKGLQDENGFFYHPQWGKELTDVNTLRRSRDLNWCEGILKALGASPTYDTPGGAKGDGVLPTATRLTGRLGVGVSLAASRVVAASESATAVADHLKTKAALLEYLNAFDMENNSYGAGSELSSQSKQFIARDVTLEAEGASWRVCDVVIDFLDSKQYATTGTWHAEKNYMGVNGLLKISDLYNALERRMNYPLEAAESAIAAITTSEEPLTICYPYNAWYSVTNIQKNLRNYSENKEEGARQAAALSAALMENAPASIAATKEKYLKFLKDDGSFSYNQTTSANNASGMPVAVPGTNEGDVNATEIATAGVLGHMFSALGLTKVPFFGDSHRLLYLRTLEGLGAVIKDEENTEINYITYDEDGVGKAPLDASLTINSSGSVTVEEDGREGKSGNVLRIHSVNDGGDTVTYSCDSMRADAKCFVFESYMCIESTDVSGNIIQVTLGNKAYMLNLKTVDGEIRISDVSSGSNPRLDNDFGVEIDIGTWFHLKAEYYPANEDNVRAKVYVDGELVGITDNYYDSTGAKLNGRTGKPSQAYIQASVYVMSYHNATVLLDDTACYKTNTAYKALTTLDEQPHVNIDEYLNNDFITDPDTGKGVYYNDQTLTDATRYHYNLMGYPMPTLSGPAYASSTVEGGMLVFKRTAASGVGESYLNFRVTPPTAEYENPCTVIEFDYRISEDNIANDNAPFRFDDSNYIRFVKNSSGNSYSLGTANTAEIVCGEWVNICFEIYYVNEFCEFAKIFVDGEYATTVRFVNISPFNERLIVYLKKNIKQGTEINIDNMFFAHLEKEYVAESDEFRAQNVSLTYNDAPANGEYYNSDIKDGAVRYDYQNGSTPSLSGSAAMVLNKNNSALLMKIGSGEGYISYSLSAPAATEHPCTVFELDYKMIGLDPTHDNAPFRLDGNDFLRFVKNSDGKSWSIGEKDTAEIVEGSWYNIRFEIYYVSESLEIAEVYIDGVHTATVELTEVSAYNARVLIYMKKGVGEGSVIFVDNVFYAHLDKEYTGALPGEGGTEEEPDGGTGDSGNTGDTGNAGDSDNTGGTGTVGGTTGDVIDGSGDTLLPGPDMAADGWTPLT